MHLVGFIARENWRRFRPAALTYSQFSVHALLPATMRPRLKLIILRNGLVRILLGKNYPTYQFREESVEEADHLLPIRWYASDVLSDGDRVVLRIATSEIAQAVLDYEFQGTREEFYNYGLLAGWVSVPPKRRLLNQAEFLARMPAFFKDEPPENHLTEPHVGKMKR